MNMFSKSQLSKSKKTDFLELNEDGFSIVIINKGSTLWHGTISNTYDKKWKPDLSRSIYLSTRSVARKYGTMRDTSRVVSVVHHDAGYNPRKKDIVPLYYIEGSHGIDVEFYILQDLKLINIGNETNIIMLIHRIHESKDIDSKTKKDIINVLSETCFNAERDDNDNVIKIKECVRKSNDSFDKYLVELICNYPNIILPANIHGWVYFKDDSEKAKSTHHFEILLCKPYGLIEYSKTVSVQDTEYDGIPTWKEFKNSRPMYNNKYSKNDIKLVQTFKEINITS